jgi:hypothetical protein
VLASGGAAAQRRGPCLEGDPNIVLAALQKSFGAILDNATFDKCWDLDGDASDEV